MVTTVSIIICTQNRAQSLKPTLESIGHATVPDGWKVELLVVDNASTDKTQEIIAAAHLDNVVLRSVREPNPGLSHARNTGLRETTGDIILFTDDDIRVPVNWIIAMCQPLLDGKADAVAGGVTFPADILALMSHLPATPVRNWLASTEGLDPVRPGRMVGANMAFHRRVLNKVPGFDPELGPGKNALGSGDETLFSLRLIAAGYKLAGALDVTVEHHFELRRLEISEVMRAARIMGRTQAFMFHHWEHQRSRLPRFQMALTKIKLYRAKIFSHIQHNGNSSDIFKTLTLEARCSFYQEYLKQAGRVPKYPKE